MESIFTSSCCVFAQQYDLNLNLYTILSIFSFFLSSERNAICGVRQAWQQPVLWQYESLGYAKAREKVVRKPLLTTLPMTYLSLRSLHRIVWHKIVEWVPKSLRKTNDCFSFLTQILSFVHLIWNTKIQIHSNF